MLQANTEFLSLELEGDGAYEQVGYAQGPERALLSALLFDAIQLFLAGRSPRSFADVSAFRETQAWIISHDREYVFSFENVCEALGIDPDYLRLGLINAFNSRRFRQMRKREG